MFLNNNFNCFLFKVKQIKTILANSNFASFRIKKYTFNINIFLFYHFTSNSVASEINVKITISKTLSGLHFFIKRLFLNLGKCLARTFIVTGNKVIPHIMMV